MDDIKDVGNVLIKTVDGISAIIWALIFTALFIRSIAIEGFTIESSKYVGCSVISLLLFLRFRTNDSGYLLKTNLWGFANVNGFGFFIIFKEFFK